MTIKNEVSYAKWVHGAIRQATVMARIGWKKLEVVAVDKIGRMKEIYEAAVDKAIKELGL